MTSGGGSGVGVPDITTTTTTTTTTTKKKKNKTSSNDRDIRSFWEKKEHTQKRKKNKKRGRKQDASNVVDLSNESPSPSKSTALLAFMSCDGFYEELQEQDIPRLTQGITQEQKYLNDGLVNFYLRYVHTEFSKVNSELAQRIFIF